MTDYSASQGCSRDDGCVRRPRGYSFDSGCETGLEESHPRGDPDCSLVKVRLVAEKAIPRTSAGTPEARAGGDGRGFPTPVKHLEDFFPGPVTPCPAVDPASRPPPDPKPPPRPSVEAHRCSREGCCPSSIRHRREGPADLGGRRSQRPIAARPVRRPCPLDLVGRGVDPRLAGGVE